MIRVFSITMYDISTTKRLDYIQFEISPLNQMFAQRNVSSGLRDSIYLLFHFEPFVQTWVLNFQKWYHREELIILLKTEIEYTYILIYITLSYICVELKFQALQLPLRNNICNIENIIVYLYFVYHHNLQYYNFSRSSTTNRSKREKNDISDDSNVFKTKLIIMKLQKFQW